MPGPTHRKALAVLDGIKFPRNQTRQNVRDEKTREVLGMAVGVVAIRMSSECRASRYTLDNPEPVRALVAYARRYIPEFRFSTIQINKNNRTALHVDRNNMGPSAIIGLGDYAGGEVWISGRGAVNCKNRFVFFDGNEPHATLPFTGTRYTLVFFTTQRYAHLAREHVPIIRGLGFPLPPMGKRAPTKQKYPPVAPRLERAQVELKEVLAARRGAKRRAPRRAARAA